MSADSYAALSSVVEQQQFYTSLESKYAPYLEKARQHLQALSSRSSDMTPKYPERSFGDDKRVAAIACLMYVNRNSNDFTHAWIATVPGSNNCHTFYFLDMLGNQSDFTGSYSELCMCFPTLYIAQV